MAAVENPASSPEAGPLVSSAAPQRQHRHTRRLMLLAIAGLSLSLSTSVRADDVLATDLRAELVAPPAAGVAATIGTVTWSGFSQKGWERVVAKVTLPGLAFDLTFRGNGTAGSQSLSVSLPPGPAGPATVDITGLLVYAKGGETGLPVPITVNTDLIADLSGVGASIESSSETTPLLEGAGRVELDLLLDRTEAVSLTLDRNLKTSWAFAEIF